MGLSPPPLTAGVAVLALAATIAVPAVAGSTPTSVRDLHYGEVLFHFYQQEYFDAITRLLAAREQSRLEHHADEAELLLGGLSLSYGMQRRAEGIFERLLAGDPRAQVRDRAWFHLAKIAWQRADPARAAAALARAGTDLAAPLDAERQMLAAMLAMGEGRYGDAVSTLDQWDAPDEWLGYARFNLGVALVRHGVFDEGTRLLASVGDARSAGAVQTRRRWLGLLMPWRLFLDGERELPLAYDEARGLADQARLALGFAYLQKGVPAQAATALAGVGGDGPWTSRALLARGWAEAELGRYDAALAAWTELARGDALDPAVQESWLAVPYALGQRRAHADAVAGYHSAIAGFDAELARLDTIASRVGERDFLDGLLANAGSDEPGQAWALAELPDTDEARYLYHLLADHRFQEGVKNYRDLRFLQRNLAAWRSGAAAFAEMLAAREQRYRERLAPVEAALDDQRLAELAGEAQGLAARLEQIAAQRDATAFATAEEHASQARLARAGARLRTLPRERLPEGAEDRHRLLEGSLLWQLEAQYPQRLWDARKGVRSLLASLEQTEMQREALAAASEGSEEALRGFDVRLATLMPRIDALQVRVSASLDGGERYLQGLAFAELDSRRERLRAYLVEAQFALANVYDNAAHARDAR